MRILLTFILLTTSVHLFGQDTKKKTVSNDYPRFKETFYVLKSDQETKHGEYKKTYGGLSIKGQYDNNKKTGVWEYYDRSGELEQKIDFSANKVISAKPMTLITDYFIKVGDSYKEVTSQEAPVFQGGQSGIIYYIWNLRYPADARRMGTEGKVLISATITQDGKMIDEEILDGPGNGLKEEALRVIQMIPDEWIAGKVNDKTVDIKIVIPVTFKLG
jgi:periplasmic protein TonB